VIAAALCVVAQYGVIGREYGVVALALYAACAGLAYLLFVNLTKRKLGAPLIAAVLYGAHPFAARMLAGDSAPLRLAGIALGLLGGVFLARTPLEPRLVWPVLAAYAGSLPFAPQLAATPFLVAAAAVAYHGLEPAKLLTKRLLPRFAMFLVPLAAWTAWSVHEGPPRGFASSAGDVAEIVLPFVPRVDAAWLGGGLVAALVLVGAWRLRAAPKTAWPLLAAGLALASAAVLNDVWGFGPPAFVATAFFARAIAEGIEGLFYRFGAAVAAPLMFVVYAALAVQSHVAAAR
jgi:hypothetical protein